MAEQHFQIGIKGLIQNSKKEILLLHVPKWGHNPDHWDLPGGRMEPGETMLETLRRELQEEIGTTYINSPVQLMSVLTSITVPVGSSFIPLVLVLYKVDLEQNTSLNLDKDLHEDKYQWFPLKEALKLLEFKFSPDVSNLEHKLR